MGDDFGISDQDVTVTAPSIDYSGGGFDDPWLTGFTPGPLDQIGVDPVTEGSSEAAAADPSSAGGSISSILQALGGGRGLLSDASGLAGLLAAHGMQGLANQITRESNPFGAYRDQYAKQLQTLMANPTSVESDPGFTGSRDQALQQVQKSMAAQGYKGSGNMAAGLYDRSNNFELDYINNKENQLAQLAGAGIAPNYSGAVSAQGQAAGLESSGLAAIGAGLGYATPAINVLGGGAAAGTPAAAKPGGFNSAGGEAASILGLANKGIGLTNNIGKIAGSDSNVISRAQGSVGGTIGDAALGLGIYSGIRQGGVAGYAGAATSSVQLASNLGLVSQGIGQAAGAIAAPLAVYNFGKNWKSGAGGADALSGASAGAAIGTAIMPGIGTAIGAIGGALVGGISSLAGPGKKDPETAQWDQYLPAATKNPDVSSQVQNPFLLMAGLFDEKSSSLPMYQQYGRMGENKFTVDMTTQINQALANGTIQKTDNADTVYNKVVAPWVQNMGQGWSGVGPEYTQATQGLLKQMTSQYLDGSYQQNWKAVGGDYAFSGGSQGSIQPFGATTATQMAAQPTGMQTAKPTVRAQPINMNTGNVLQGIAMGVQNNFRGLKYA